MATLSAPASTTEVSILLDLHKKGKGTSEYVYLPKYSLAGARDQLSRLPRETMATLSAPASTTEVPILLDLNQKQTVTPAQCALVTTSQYVTLPNARPIAVDSGSVVKSLVSSAERRRRYAADLAIFKLAEKRVQLAEAHVAFITSRDQLSAGSLTDTALLPSQDGVSAPFRAFRSAPCIPSHVGSPEDLAPSQDGPIPGRTPPPSQDGAPPPIQHLQVTSECRTYPATLLSQDRSYAPCAVAIRVPILR